MAKSDRDTHGPRDAGTELASGKQETRSTAMLHWRAIVRMCASRPLDSGRPEYSLSHWVRFDLCQ